MFDINIDKISQRLLDYLDNEPFGKSLFTPNQGGSINNDTHSSPTTM